MAKKVIKARIKIGFIIHWLKGGGSEKQLLFILRGLIRIGFKCEVFCLSNSKIPPEFAKQIHLLKSLGIEFHTAHPHKLSNVFFAIKKIISREFHLVWTWGIQSDLVGTIIKILDSDIKHICSLRSAYSNKVKKEYLVRKGIDVFADAYISNSAANCNIIHKIVNVEKTKLFLLHNIIEKKKLIILPKKKPKVLNIVMLGNLRTYVKGYDFLHSICHELIKHKILFKIFIAGRNDYGKQFLKKLTTGKLAKKIVYQGETAQVSKHLSQGHIFLLTSRIEGMPNSLFEAMAHGLPCVTTKVGDIGNLILDKRHVIIAENINASSIATAINLCYKNWSESIQMGIRARDYCQQKFDNVSTVNKCQEILNCVYRQ
jgi:glycosyltransferase involved in cell wall biosynthesis